jgi:hypothetical protein
VLQRLFGAALARSPAMEYRNPLNAGLVLPFQRPRESPQHFARSSIAPTARSSALP